jgi:hypothetical protein
MAGDDGSCYNELYVYSGTRGREFFILQLVVDAHGAQAATQDTKPIAIVFALVGLFLHVERGYTGLQVQQVHMRLGRTKHQWPTIALPDHRGGITAADVLKAPAGSARDAAISDWCRDVWQAFSGNRATILQLLQSHGIL